MTRVPTPPSASSIAVRNTMRGNRSRDTKPEIAVRSALYEMGHRYRISIRPVPNIAARADIVFSRARLAVFVDGCFWHACPIHYSAPRTNSVYWQAKIAHNVERDVAVTAALEAAGWRVLRVWEHVEPYEAAATIAAVLRSRGNASRTRSSGAQSELLVDHA